MLNVERVGITDNFFELGGDSIKAIQVSSRLNINGWKLGIKHLIEFPFIKEVSRYMQRTEIKQDQGEITGEVKLTPIQSWFFQQHFTEMHHWNHSVMLTRRGGYDPSYVQKTIASLVKHHDALRMVYRRENSQIMQWNNGYIDQIQDIFTCKYIHPEMNQEEKIEYESNNLQRSIDLQEGPLFKGILFKGTQEDHMLLVAHHLVIDGVSWRIVIEDFIKGYDQCMRSEEIQFQPKSTSYKEWSEKLGEYSTSRSLLNEVPYWKEIEKAEIQLIPQKHTTPIMRNRLEDAGEVSMKLTVEESEKLVKSAHRIYNTVIDDVLLTGLAIAIHDWSGIYTTAISMESHGREEIAPGQDISRTLGWFTSIYPIVLNMENCNDVGYLIKNTKEMLRKIPKKGVGYGILKYITPKELCSEINFGLNPQISFNYLGDFKNSSWGETYFSPYSGGISRSPISERIHDIELNGMTREGSIEFTIAYNRHWIHREDMEKFAEFYKKGLLSILKHCENKEKREVTPSDLGHHHGLSIEQLQEIEKQIYKRNK
ncbi:Surfactin synthase subunit 1 [compost metagenome]